MRSLQRPLYTTPEHRRLIDRTWLYCGPSFPASPPLSLPFPLSLSLSPQSQGCAHRLDTANRDAARAQRSLKNGTTTTTTNTRPVDLSIPSPPLLPASFSRVVAVQSLTELPGEWRWVSCVCVCVCKVTDDLRGLCARCWRMEGAPHPAVPLAGERSCAERRRLPLSARLGYEWCIKRGKKCSSRFSFPSILILNLYDIYTQSTVPCWR